jgi:hypothetical protein
MDPIPQYASSGPSAKGVAFRINGIGKLSHSSSEFPKVEVRDFEMSGSLSCTGSGFVRLDLVPPKHKVGGSNPSGRATFLNKTGVFWQLTRSRASRYYFGTTFGGGGGP